MTSFVHAQPLPLVGRQVVSVRFTLFSLPSFLYPLRPSGAENDMLNLKEWLVINLLF
jgi:hypothetical protein